MKRIAFALSLVWFCMLLFSRSADVQFNLSDFAANPLAIKTVRVTPVSAPQGSGTTVITGDAISYTTDTNGTFTVTNMAAGSYKVECVGGNVTTSFYILTPTNLTEMSAAGLLTQPVGTTGGQMAFATKASDLRYPSAWGTNVIVYTNGSGRVVISSSGGDVTAAQLVSATNNTLNIATNASLQATNNLSAALLAALTSATNNTLNIATNASLQATNNLSSAFLAALVTATNQAHTALTNFSISTTQGLLTAIANVAATNLVDYNLTVPGGLNWNAQQDAITYARNVAAYGGPNMITNGKASILAAGLSVIYNYVGQTSLVDFAVFGDGFTVTSGTNFPTLKGFRGGSANVSISPAGLHFNGTNSFARWNHLPSNQTNTVAIRFASETNQTGSAYQWLYSLVHTNGYTSGMNNSLGFNSSTFYPWTYTTTLFQGRGVFGTYFNGGPAEGLYRGNRQFHNAIIVMDGYTNCASWVDGLASTNFTQNLGPQACNQMLLGMRSDNAHYFRGLVQQYSIYNRALTSNEQFYVDAAMALIAQEVPFVAIGDSRTFFDYTDFNQGREWMQQLWWRLGPWTNRAVVHNFAISGIQAQTQIANSQRIAVSRRPTLAWSRPHAFVDIGFNDINNGVSASNTWIYASNIYFNLRSNGYIVHANTILPSSTVAAGYTAAKWSNIARFNLYLLDSTNSQIRPVDYVWDTSGFITDTNGTTQLFDGIHPTNSVHTSIGTLIANEYLNWLR